MATAESMHFGKGAYVYDAANRATAVVPREHKFKLSMWKFAAMITNWVVEENYDRGCETIANKMAK